jgi:hypothetical protein
MTTPAAQLGEWFVPTGADSGSCFWGRRDNVKGTGFRLDTDLARVRLSVQMVTLVSSETTLSNDEVHRMPAQNIKEAAHELIEQMSDDAGWDEVVYRMAVRRSIEIGLRQSEVGEVVDTATVRAELGLME